MNNMIEQISNRKITVNYIDKNIKIDKAEQELIDNYWKTVPSFFTRGKIFVVDNIRRNSNSILIDVSNSDYAHYIFVRRNPGKARDCYNLWAGILLETLDKKYVIGKMSNITSSAGEYHISGGSCDKGDISDNSLNYEKTMYRELKEEIGLEKEDLREVCPKYIKNAFFTEQDIGIIFKAIVNKTSKELEEFYNNYLNILKKQNGEIEFDNLEYIDKNIKAINDFCLSSKTPEYTRRLLLEDASEK